MSQGDRYRRLQGLRLAALLVTLTAVACALYAIERHFLAAAGETLALAAADIADKVDLILYERSGDLQALTKASAPPLARGDRAALTAHLAAVQQAHPLYLWIGVTDATGRIVAATDAVSVGQDRSGQAWFRAVRDGASPHVEAPRLDEDAGGAWAIAYSAPVIGADGRIIGVATMRVSLAPLTDLFSRTLRILLAEGGLPKDAEWQFLSRDGTVLDESLPPTQVPTNLLDLGVPSARLSLDPNSPAGSIEERHTRRGVTVVTGYAHTQGYGRFQSPLLGVLVRMDREDLMAPIWTIIWRTGAVAAVVVLPLLGLTLWSTRQLHRAWHRATASEEEVRRLNAELEQRVVERTARLKTAYDRLEMDQRLQAFAAKVGTSLVADMTLSDGLHASTEAMVQYLGAAFARIWTLDPAENILILRASSGMYTNIEGRHHRVPVGQYKIGLIAQERRPHLTNQVIGDPRVHDQEWAKREGMVAFAGYPLLVEGHVLGVMAMFARKPLSNDVLRDLQSVAHTVAMFIERKQAAEALSRSEAWFRSLIENAADVIVVADQEGTILFESPSVERVFGYRPEEVVGRNAFEFIHPDDHRATREALTRALSTPGITDTIEIRTRAKDATWHVVEIRGQLVVERGDRPRLVLNLRDITERKRAETELSQSREMLRLIIDNIPEYVFWKDCQLRYLGCNRLFARSAGVGDPAAIVGKDDFELAWKDTAERYQADDRSVMEAGTPKLNYEEPQTRPDGSVLWLQTSKVPLIDRAGQVFGMLGVYSDITERKAMAAKAHQLERLAALGQLLGGIAHEIKNPLFILTGHLQLLEDKLRHPPAGDLEPDLHKLNEAAKRLAAITDRFLQLARSAPTKPGRCSVLAALQAMLEFLTNELMRNQIRVVTHVAADLPPVWADRRQLEEIFLNLMLNALQAMAQANGQGTLTVKAELVAGSQQRAASEEKLSAIRYQLFAISYQLQSRNGSRSASRTTDRASRPSTGQKSSNRSSARSRRSRAPVWACGSSGRVS